MKRSSLNFTVDIVTFLAALGLVSTGLLLRFVLPPGSRGGAGLSVWNWSRHEWGDIHFYVAAGIACLVIVHLALHWGWTWQMLRRVTARNDSEQPHACVWKRNLLGAGVLAATGITICAFLYLAQAGIKSEGAARPHGSVAESVMRSRDDGGERRGDRSGERAGPRRHRGGKAQESNDSNTSSESRQKKLAGSP